MTIKILGSLLVVLGCGGVGLLIARNAKKEIIALENFILALEYMECELCYRMMPLSALCTASANISKGCVSKLFQFLGRELDLQIAPDVSDCMKIAIFKCDDLPHKIAMLAEKLGAQLGRFNLDGQVQILIATKEEAKVLLSAEKEMYNLRGRSYRTLAVCAGAALVILLI